jgi:hypothetical protein
MFENEASSFGDFFAKISDETNLQKVKKLKFTSSKVIEFF